jgi:hypothetical protein
MFMVLVVAAAIRHIDPSECAKSKSSATCALHDESFATTYGIALVIGGLLACAVALLSRRPNDRGDPHMNRWRSVGWSLAAAIVVPFTVISAASRPWLRDTLVTTVIVLGIRSVVRVLAPELTGRTFDELVAGGRDAFDR